MLFYTKIEPPYCLAHKVCVILYKNRATLLFSTQSLWKLKNLMMAVEVSGSVAETKLFDFSSGSTCFPYFGSGSTCFPHFGSGSTCFPYFAPAPLVFLISAPAPHVFLILAPAPRVFLISAPAPRVFLISAPAPAPALYCHLKMWNFLVLQHKYLSIKVL